jgi:hypothetical protein
VTEAATNDSGPCILSCFSSAYYQEAEQEELFVIANIQISFKPTIYLNRYFISLFPKTGCLPAKCLILLCLKNVYKKTISADTQTAPYLPVCLYPDIPVRAIPHTLFAKMFAKYFPVLTYITDNW